MADLDEILKSLNKKYGGDSNIVDYMASMEMTKDVIPTGSLALDVAIGCGGWPMGRICQVWGRWGVGKTTLCQHAVKSAQELYPDLRCAFIDSERGVDRDYMAACGVDLKNVIFSTPDTGEQALEIAAAIIGSGEVSVVVIDSVALMTPKNELEAAFDKNHMALLARMMGTAMRKLAGPVKKNNVLLLFTNQYRKNPNEQVMRGSTKVASEDPSGGLALQFAASVSVKLRTMGKSSGGQVMRGKEQVGQRIHADIMKNKVGKPFGTAEFDIVWGAGIDRVSDVLDTATRLDIIHRAGASYSFGDRKLGVGRDNVRAMLAEDAILVEEIYQHTIAEVRGGKVIAPAPEPMPDEDEGEEE